MPRERRKPGQRRPPRKDHMGTHGHSTDYGATKLVTFGIPTKHWVIGELIFFLGFGLWALASGHLAAGIAIVAGGGAVCLLLLKLAKPVPKTTGPPMRPGEVECPACGSLQTDTEEAFDEEGEAFLEWVCYACDHRWLPAADGPQAPT